MAQEEAFSGIGEGWVAQAGQPALPLPACLAVPPRYVHAGDVILGTEGDELRAVLGSCVAVTLWHPARRMGVMNHVLLPRRRSASTNRGRQSDTRYAKDALLQMFEHLASKGVSPSDCVCKLFGGARVFGGHEHGVGKANVRELKRLLDRAGVRVASESVEGTGHRLVRFVIRTGDVWVRHRHSQLLVSGLGAGETSDTQDTIS